MKKYRIFQKCISISNEDEFDGFYKGYHIYVRRELSKIDINDEFFISVEDKEGEYLYDGNWCPEKENVPINDAIEEALVGSDLI